MGGHLILTVNIICSPYTLGTFKGTFDIDSDIDIGVDIGIGIDIDIGVLV